ncbi:hypothetical protein LPJ66_005945, partial [Kickxella alabastrina]
MSKYTVCVPGYGAATADTITSLQINNSSFRQLVERAISGWDAHNKQKSTGPGRQPGTIWLDIHSPSQGDIDALASIFNIDSASALRLSHNIGDRAVDPECKAADMSLYLCWAETTASKGSAAHYFSHGTINPADGSFEAGDVLVADGSTAATTIVGDISASGASGRQRQQQQQQSWTGGYFPVPPWLQPSATQVLSRLDLRKRPKKTKTGEPIMNPAGIDSMRQQRMKQLLGMFSKPTVVNKERTHAVLKRWGPGHEQWWQEVLNSAGSRQSAPKGSNCVAEQLTREARDLIGYQIVQVWTCGPVILTFHKAESAAVTRVMRELAVQDPRLLRVAPLAIVEGLVDHWIYKVQECLQVVKSYTDKLDHDLTRPVQNSSVEAAIWTPVIARCRKAALALLRRCQVNEMVLSQLCSAANLVFSPSHSEADALSDRALLPFGRQMTMRDIAGQNPVQRLGVLQNQLFVSHTTRVQYKKAEQRLSRLHTILLDRQRLRLLSTQKDIHKYFRTLVTVELV